MTVESEMIFDVSQAAVISPLSSEGKGVREGASGISLGDLFFS